MIKIKSVPYVSILPQGRDSGSQWPSMGGLQAGRTLVAMVNPQVHHQPELVPPAPPFPGAIYGLVGSFPDAAVLHPPSGCQVPTLSLSCPFSCLAFSPNPSLSHWVPPPPPSQGNPPLGLLPSVSWQSGPWRPQWKSPAQPTVGPGGAAGGS